jgi:HlyD family secretion protein
MKRLLLAVLVLALAGIGVLAWVKGGGQPQGQAPVVVTRGSVVRVAVAVGQVDPEYETPVNTQLGGFARKVHVALGQKVNAGDPLAEVWPALTERDLLGAERSLQSAMEGEDAAREFVQGEHALAYLTRLLQGERNLDRMQRSAERGRRSAEESLQLVREGKVEIDGRTIDFVVRAPVGGHVLQVVRQGDPVTPASNFGAGTVVAVLGDLDKPVFRGTVDEIDVGRLAVGMRAKVTLGALPEASLTGTVSEIALRARRQDSAALFDVRIAVQTEGAVALRAGYSAVAEVELARASDVLVLPERTVQFRGKEAFVRVPKADGSVEERAIEVGLSDGLRLEVRGGLREGDAVLERTVGR